MHILNQQFINDEEPERPTPCFYDPERWQPDEQKPDPAAVAACWSCFFQSRCARRALALNTEFGICAGYRLAPGPGLARSRQDLRIVAGLEMGPPRSPGVEACAELARQAQVRAGSKAAAATVPAKSHAPSAAIGAETGDLSQGAPEPAATPNTAAVVALRAHHAPPRRRRHQPTLAAAGHRVRAQAG
jgi:hypothetical protein